MNFWDRRRGRFLEKSKNIVCDVTVWAKEIKFYVQIECQLCHIMMLILNSICQYERRYAILNKNICHFWDRHRALFPEKNPIHRNVYKLMQCCALDFPRKKRSLTVPLFEFSQDSRITVKHRNGSIVNVK